MEENKNDVEYVSFNALTLFKTLDGGNDYAKLDWSLRGSYPRVVCVTSKDHKKEDGSRDYSKVITGAMNTLILREFINNARRVIAGPAGGSYKLKCYGNTFVNRVRTDDIELTATVIIAKDKEGKVFMGVIRDNTPMHRFDFVHGRYHVTSVDGVDILDTPAGTVDIATAYFDELLAIINNMSREIVYKQNQEVTKRLEAKQNGSK